MSRAACDVESVFDIWLAAAAREETKLNNPIGRRRRLLTDRQRPRENTGEKSAESGDENTCFLGKAHGGNTSQTPESLSVNAV